jgi:ubiquinone/menaquinone biosynthesis C-methylase UbiE
VAATYDRAAFPFFTPFGEVLVERAQIRSDERVLDAGCGSGAALVPAAARAREVVGVDISASMVERAREAAPEATVEVGDATALAFPDESFDVVLSAFVVFFPPDPTAALREWRRVLVPGGRLAMSTWGAADPRWAWEREVRREFIEHYPPELLKEMGTSLERLGRFDEQGKVAAELEAAGFEPEAVEPVAIEFRFADEQAWWEWNWSHAARAALEPLAEATRERFRERAFEAMKPLRDGSGGFPRTYTALVATARRG